MSVVGHVKFRHGLLYLKTANYFQFLHLFHYSIIDRYELVAEGKYCSGKQGLKQWTTTVNVCALECERMGSTMFVYGIKGTDSCVKVGCACYCQKSASADGTCQQVDAKDNDGKNTYNLYKIKKLGKILIIGTSLRKLHDQEALQHFYIIAS